MLQAKLLTRRHNFLDGLAVGLSFTCLVHCLALPVLIALLPAWSAWLEVPESFHVGALAFAAPLSLATLARAGRFRLDFLPLRVGAGGLILMAIALAMPTDEWEAIVTSIGASGLAIAHIVNWRSRVRRCRKFGQVGG